MNRPIHSLEGQWRCLLLLAPALWPGFLWAQTDAASLVSGRSAALQQSYLEAYLASKSGGNSPAKNLTASAKFRASVPNPPSLGSTSLLADLELRGRTLFEEAELRYRIGRFESAAAVLAMIPTDYRRLHPATVDLLQLRLALRGFVEPPKNIQPSREQANNIQWMFNQILLLVQKRQPAEALTRLGEISKSGAYERTARDRATIWAAIISAQQEQNQPSPVLPDLTAEHPLGIDWLIAYLRTRHDAHPEAAAAIERHVVEQMPDSIARWELREYVLRSLVRSGASNQATALAVRSMTQLTAAQAQLEQRIQQAQRMSEQEQTALLPALSERSKIAVAELIAKRRELKRTAAILLAWQPHLEQTIQSLAADRRRLADEIARSGAEPTRKEDLDDLQHFQKQLAELVGHPPTPETALRLFTGMATWEYKTSYPENWRPEGFGTSGLTDPESKRRRINLDMSSGQRFAMANEQIGKLNEETRVALAGPAQGGLEGMRPRAESLLKQNRATIKDIEARLPDLDAAIGAEIRKDLLDRREGFQKWVNRFGYLAVLAYGKSRPNVAQPYFDLDKRLPLRAGVPLIEAIQQIPVATKVRTLGETDGTSILQALQVNAVTANRREIRADALRMRASLVLSLSTMNQAMAGSEAIRHYDELLAQYRDLVDAAEITYQLAHALEIKGELGASQAMLHRFIKDFPRDRRAPEVHFRIGEAQYGQGDFGAARKSYEDVIRLGKSRYRDQAEYKLAWAHYKQGEFAQAVQRFISVIDHSGDWSTAGATQERERAVDAFRALSLSFHNLGGVTAIDQHFAVPAAKRPYAPVVYANLTRYYLDHARVADAAKTYQRLTAAFPNDSRGPGVHAELIRVAAKEKLAAMALELKVDFTRRYASTTAFWRQSPPRERQDIEAHMAPILLELGQLHHADAQQRANTAAWPQAVAYYTQLVESFPANALAPRVNFLLAEARYESGDLLGAMASYDAAAYRYGAHPDAPEAGYAGLIATQRWVGTVTEPTEKIARLRQLIERSQRFSASFPADQRVNGVMIKAAEDLLMVGEAAAAADLGSRLLARQPDISVRRRGTVVIAHGQFESQQYAESEISYQRALDIAGHTPTVLRELKDRQALAIYRQGEAHRARGELAVAADTFLRVGRVQPDAEIVPKAQIDAAAAFLSGQQWGAATKVLENFLSRFPKHELAADVPLRLAYALENDGKLILAAERFESLSAADQSEISRLMLVKAADLREKAGRPELAAPTRERYLTRFPKPAEPAAEARQWLAEHFAAGNDPVTRDRWLAELIAEAKKHPSEATPRIRFLAAQASVLFGDARARAFDAIAIKLPLAQSLAEKRNALEQSLRWYDQAATFGVAEITTGATFKTAELYRRLARDLMASERPGGLSELEQRQYKLLLEEETGPFEDKSTALHELNYHRIKDGIYDEWVKRSLIALRTLNPARYNKIEKVGGVYEYIAPAPPTPSTPSNQSTLRPPGAVQDTPARTPTGQQSAATNTPAKGDGK